VRDSLEHLMIERSELPRQHVRFDLCPSLDCQRQTHHCAMIVACGEARRTLSSPKS
jgi:hypothetical protein